MGAHKAMLTEALQTLGIPLLDIVDGLILPGTTLGQLDMALASLYKEGNILHFSQMCRFIKMENKEDLSGESNKPTDAVLAGDIGSGFIQDTVCESQEKDAKIPKNLKQYVCDQCDYTTTHIEGVRKHSISYHENVADHKCEFCDFHAQDRYRMIMHRKDFHPDGKKLNMVKKISCDFCNFVVSGKGKNRL